MDHNFLDLISKRSFALLSAPGHQQFEVFHDSGEQHLTNHQGFFWKVGRFNPNDNRVNVHSVSKQEYLIALNNVIQKLKTGEVQKVVFSRCEHVEAPSLSREVMPQLANLLREVYPSACIYLYAQEQDIFWIGATPELLLRKKGNRFETVALAGTRKVLGENIPWGEKEVREQKVVTDFILKKLSENGATHVECSKPYTFGAGKIEHIKTDIAFTSEHSVDFWIGALHPTPAVSGLPQEAAIQFIHEMETYNREFYAGWFGKVGKDEAEIYVHLRCAKLDLRTKRITYFAGGGIMPDSDPLLEWQETANKMNTLKEVIGKLL